MKDGVLLIDKPKEFTSFDVVAKVRGMLSVKKIGHAGTLDPNATGVLPLFIGSATKACDILPRHDKRYLVTFRLGLSSDTQDIWGQVTQTREVAVNCEQVEQTCLSFVGHGYQLPPMYSAVQVNGTRLYDLARQGIEVSRKPRAVTFFEIKFLGQTGDCPHEYKIEVHCSKGAYIRTLCHDIGERLKCGAVMTSLRRTMAAGFGIEDCISLDTLQALNLKNKADDVIIPIEYIFQCLPKVILNPVQQRIYLNGAGLDPLRMDGQLIASSGEKERLYTVYTSEGVFIGIGRADFEHMEFKTFKMFLRRE